MLFMSINHTAQYAALLTPYALPRLFACAGGEYGQTSSQRCERQRGKAHPVGRSSAAYYAACDVQTRKRRQINWGE